MKIHIGNRKLILAVLTSVSLLIYSGCGKKASIEGMVVSYAGEALNGVTVIAKQMQPVKGYEEKRAVTSVEGKFALKGLYPESQYTIMVESKNWQSHKRDAVLVSSGPEGETSLLNEPVKVTLATNETGSLILDLETGITRFEKSAEGFITDALTAREWYVLPGKLSWFAARDKISSMGDGWRLPRLDELQRLYVKDLGVCNSDPLFELQYGDMFGGDFYAGCVWTNYLKRLPFNLTISQSFRFPFGSPNPHGGDPDANNDKMRAFAVRNLEDM